MNDRPLIPYGLGPRCAAFLRTRYPEGEVIKGAMRDLRCGRSRAKELLAGQAPTSSQLEEMVGLWGDDLLRAVFVEAWERQDKRIELVQQREEEMRRRAEAAEALIEAYKQGMRFRIPKPEYAQALEQLTDELTLDQPLTSWARFRIWLRGLLVSA